MATAVLLSQHSSNPLEVSSSDVRNRVYRQRYMEATRGRAVADESSDDPINGFHKPDMEEYHTHLAQLFPTSNYQDKRPQRGSKSMVDLDEDAEDELALEGQHNLSIEMDNEDEDEFEDLGSGNDTDEETTIRLKSREEQEEIEEEIADLEEAVPQLTEDYKIVDRLGTGTFSSVYKAIDIGYHDKWDNTAWHGRHPPSSSAHYQSLPHPNTRKVFVAVKRIYVTSNPERIRNEIAIMDDCRGCRHVSQLITAFRSRDQVVAIMPYHRNEDFREFYRILPMAGIKSYFRCLFRALRDIHARGIIHRDVKPANFLFDPQTGIGTLCDFGLASRMEPGPSHGACLHVGATRDNPHGRLPRFTDLDLEHIRRMQKEARQKSTWPSDRVGYPEKDLRPHSKANRAGTRGFRAPEVLLKCGEQTGAIDVWATGIILLFFLTGKFPLFQSGDDTEALMEIATIIGRRKVEQAAALHSRVFATNVPSITADGIPWREFVERQNPKLMIPPIPDSRLYPYCRPDHPLHHLPSSSFASSQTRSQKSSSPEPLPTPDPESHVADIESALDLLEWIMHPESTKRMTPREALYHPFLADLTEFGDDEYFPHPFGEGVCGDLHFVDDLTEELCVRVSTDVGDGIVKVMSGEGIAIGPHPCEFHHE